MLALSCLLWDIETPRGKNGISSLLGRSSQMGKLKNWGRHSIFSSKFSFTSLGTFNHLTLFPLMCAVFYPDIYNIT